MNELKILNLNKNYTLVELKKAFREKAKELHPDLNNNSLESHLAMIRLNKAYLTLRKVLKKTDFNQENKLDDSYSIYRKGIMIFQGIHPSKWKKIMKRNLFNPNAIETSVHTIEIVKELLDDLSKAYYYFSIVFNEHSNSSWSWDAKIKMNEIEKMTIRYIKILKSYEQDL